MVYGQKEQKFGAQDKNTTVHWKSKSIRWDGKGGPLMDLVL